MELDLNNVSRQRVNVAYTVDKFLSTSCNLAPLLETTAALLH